MSEKRFIGTLRRNKNVIMLIAVVAFLILIVIIMTNRMIMQMEQNTFGCVLWHLADEPGFHPDLFTFTTNT